MLKWFYEVTVTTIPRKHSAVWLHFDDDGQEEPSKTTCQICGEAIQHSGNMSNMFKHLKKKHPVESVAIEDKRKEKVTASTSISTSRQSTLYESFTKAGKYPGM